MVRVLPEAPFQFTALPPFPPFQTSLARCQRWTVWVFSLACLGLHPSGQGLVSPFAPFLGAFACEGPGHMLSYPAFSGSWKETFPPFSPPGSFLSRPLLS